MSPRHYSAQIALTASMLALCNLSWSEDKPATAADAALKQYAADAEKTGGAERQGAAAAADYYYDRGMKAMEQGRLDDAIRDLTVAVDWQPQNEKYRKALEQAQAVAGVSRDPRSIHINRTADELSAKNQQLKVEAAARTEDGKKALEKGDFAEAERQFSYALTRLDSLPFPDQTREASQREAEKLIAIARERREKQELKDSAERNDKALQRQEALRDAGLKIERDRIDVMLKRAQKARDRRDYDEAIMLCDQVLKLNRAEDRAHGLLIKCRRERHVYLRQMTADRWDEEHKLLSESIRTAMLPQLELVNYSPDWAEIDARRSAPVHGLQEESESWRKEINNQLEQEVTLDFADHDLVDVLAFLQKITNVNIVLDPKVVAASPPPVTLRVESMKLRFVLEFVMKLTGLNYTLRDEAIYISNAMGLRGDVFMKLYDIRDLTHAMASFPGPDLDIPEPGGVGSRLLPPIEPETKPEINEFIEIIQKVVKPNSWKSDGVAIEEYNGAMVVTQTADVHKLVEELLRTLRNQRGTQIHVKVKFLTVENSLLEEIGVNWQNFNGGGVPGNRPGGSLNNPVSGLVPNAQYGAYHQQGSVIAAANVNNILQPYDNTGHSLPASNLGGMTFQTQHWRFVDDLYVSAILHAVEKERRGNVSFEPDITLFNGQQAHIVHIHQQAYIADYDVNQGQYDPIVSTLSFGTVLDVQAIASADKKYITLTLRPTNAQIASWRRFGAALTANQFLPPSGQPVPPGGGNNGGTFNGAPVTQGGGAVAGGNPLLIPELIYQSVRTSVTIPDGGSLILAGMTNGESSRSHAGIPFLSHIPFVGRLFSNNGRAETELKTLILLQADVLVFEEIERKL